MVRSVDPRRTRKALRAIARLQQAPPAAADASAAETPDPGFSEWENGFLSELGQRLETYGSAFADPSKGSPEDALSRLQQAKLRELTAKARGKAPSRFGRRQRPSPISRDGEGE
jgi:hypothetical protein